VIVDVDQGVRAAISEFMIARGYRIEVAEDARAATALLLRTGVDVLISDLSMRDPGGVDLFAFARASAPMTRSIAIASNASVEDRETALRNGALRVLSKPVSPRELTEALKVANACDEGFHGFLHGLSLVDLLQMYHLSAKSLVIEVHGEVEGSIALSEGEFVHAQAGSKVGMAALLMLLKARGGSLETSVLGQAQRTIRGSFEHVLLDSLRSLDEGRRAPVPVPVPVLDLALDEEDDAGFDVARIASWLNENAPQLSAYRVDGKAVVTEIIAEPTPAAGAPRAIALAQSLAEASDASFHSVELLAGSTMVALLRVSGLTVALARAAGDDSEVRRFRAAYAQFTRWLTAEAGARQ
jgi:CheY-like chemotaxis protein